MNDLELAIFKKNFDRNQLISLKTFIYDNQLQDKLTLNDLVSILELNIFWALYELFEFGDFKLILSMSEHINENPQIADMKISDIFELSENLENE